MIFSSQIYSQFLNRLWNTFACWYLISSLNIILQFNSHKVQDSYLSSNLMIYSKSPFELRKLHQVYHSRCVICYTSFDIIELAEYGHCNIYILPLHIFMSKEIWSESSTKILPLFIKRVTYSSWLKIVENLKYNVCETS